LNGEPKVYIQALAEARNVLQNNFNNDNPQSKELDGRLQALSAQPVSVMTPDLAQSLSSVQAYLEQRHTAGKPAAQAKQETSP